MTVAAARGTGARAGWTLVWSDEFEGDSIDRSKWDFDIGNGFYDYKNHAWVGGWGNGELQYYTDHASNASVSGSCLTIRALKESLHGCGYTSARLKTRRRDGMALFSKMYGRVEIRARVPWGKGLWPALWMLPVEDRYGGWAASGEIDLMEIVGTKPREVLNSIHFGSTFPRRSLVTATHALPAGSTVADWHVYGVEWDPGRIRFDVDGIETCVYNHWFSCGRLARGRGADPRGEQDVHPWPAPFDQPFYLVMNVAVGGNFPGNPGKRTKFPAEMVIDYVRAYDRVTGPAPLAPRGPGLMPWQPGYVAERHLRPGDDGTANDKDEETKL